MCGENEFKMSEVRRVAVVEGFAPGDPTPHMFWEVACTMSRELQRRLLAFVTGVFRVPVGGLYQLVFRVTRLDLHENAHKQPEPLPEAKSHVLPLGPSVGGTVQMQSKHPEKSQPSKQRHKQLEAVRRVRIVKRRVLTHENQSQTHTLTHKGERKAESQAAETVSAQESEQSFERAALSTGGPEAARGHVILRLPRSNVCTGQLLLPSYRSRRALQQALYFSLLNTDYLAGAFD